MPQNALPSDLLENVLCGVAFGLGVLGIIVGTALIIYFRKPCSGGTSSGGVGEPDIVVHVWACQDHPVAWGRVYSD